MFIGETLPFVKAYVKARFQGKELSVEHYFLDTVNLNSFEDLTITGIQEKNPLKK